MRDELMEKMKLSDTNDKEKNYETVLYESRSAVQNYMRTGNQSKQLQWIIECEDKFQENYKKLLEHTFKEDDVWLKQEWITNFEKSIEKLERASVGHKELLKTIYDLIQEYLQDIMSEMAYYNSMNMIYEFLDHEKLKRKEEEKFETALQTYPILESVIHLIERKRRVFVKDVEKQLSVSQEELQKAIKHVYYFFVLEEKETGVQISLAPQGMKFSQYIARRTPRWTTENMEKCVYHNCFEIMDKMENSLLQSKRLEIKLEAVSPIVERSIKSKFISTFNHVCLDRDEEYRFLFTQGMSGITGRDDYGYERKKQYRIVSKSREWY